MTLLSETREQFMGSMAFEVRSLLAKQLLPATQPCSRGPQRRAPPTTCTLCVAGVRLKVHPCCATQTATPEMKVN